MARTGPSGCRGASFWLRLHEKGGKRHDVPAHHRASAALDAYVEVAELEEPKVPLFRSVDPAGRRLTGRGLQRRVVLTMIKRRAAQAGLPPSTCCHTFRATGITAYLSNGGTLRARAADRGAGVAEDDEALRPDCRHRHCRRDRTHRDLKGTWTHQLMPSAPGSIRSSTASAGCAVLTSPGLAAGGLVAGRHSVLVDMSMLFDMADPGMTVDYTVSSSDAGVLGVYTAATDSTLAGPALRLAPMMAGEATVTVMAAATGRGVAVGPRPARAGGP